MKARLISCSLVTLVFMLLIIAIGASLHLPSQPDLREAIMLSRLWRMGAACLIGALLGLSGSLIQSLTHNPLAEMSTVGVSGGSSLALALLLISGVPMTVPNTVLVACLGSGVSLIVMLILTGRRQHQISQMILIGLLLGLFCTGIASSLAYYKQDSSRYFLWLVGSLTNITADKVLGLLATLILALVISMSLAKPIMLIAVDSKLALSLGIPLVRIQVLVLGLVALISGVTIGLVGVISFVGLLSPYLARHIVKKGFVAQLLLSSLLGAGIVLISDVLGHQILPNHELPAGSITLFIGSILLFYLAITGGRNEKNS